jgi:hypothetical protein
MPAIDAHISAYAGRAAGLAPSIRSQRRNSAPFTPAPTHSVRLSAVLRRLQASNVTQEFDTQGACVVKEGSLIPRLFAGFVVTLSLALPAFGLEMFPAEAKAQQHCPKDTVVWLNLPTMIWAYRSLRARKEVDPESAPLALLGKLTFGVATSRHSSSLGRWRATSMRHSQRFAE